MGLDVLGITDPTISKSREVLEIAAKCIFKETIKLDEEGRYQVRIPWLEDHPILPTNFTIAQKRLCNTLKKLKSDNMFKAYDDVFKEWLKENGSWTLFTSQASN